MANKRAAIELSLNFIVILIISIVIMVLGIALVTKFFSQTTTSQTEISSQLEQEIINSLRGDNPVSIPYYNIELTGGQTKLVGVGILNIFGDQRQFKVSITNPSSDITVINTNKDKPITINKGANFVETVAIGVPKGKEPGSYDISVKVEFEESPGTWKDYATRHVYITVK